MLAPRLSGTDSRLADPPPPPILELGVHQMLALPLTLALELPPHAFGSALPATQAFQPPWALTCPIEELGRPRILPLHLPRSPARTALSPEALRPRGPEHLLGPVPDVFLFLGLAVWSSDTGGHVGADAWPGKAHVSSPLLAPSLGLPPAPSAPK
jgi:hypothetical protein